MVDSSSAARGPSSIQRLINSQMARMKDRIMRQVDSKVAFTEFQEDAFNPVGIRQKFKTLKDQNEERKKVKEKGEKASEDEGALIVSPAKIDKSAEEFSRNNPELKKDSLILLRSMISDTDSADEIIKKVMDFYPDLSLADEAIDYLLQTTTGDLASKVQSAKDSINEQFGREIVAGRNIATQARSFSKEGLGSPTGLRDLYRDITGNPRTPHMLFDQLTEKFSFPKMKTTIDFLLHSLGADLKSKGSSIPRGELNRLLEDTRTLQAIMGVYKFFAGRMRLVNTTFAHNDLQMPGRLNFELLSKEFMKLIAGRYVSSDKVLQMARALGISEEELAQIIIFTQFRDAIRHTAPKLYKSEKHKQEVLTSIMDALEELEDEVDENDEGDE
jgi:type III secretion protein W